MTREQMIDDDVGFLKFCIKSMYTTDDIWDVVRMHKLMVSRADILFDQHQHRIRLHDSGKEGDYIC